MVNGQEERGNRAKNSKWRESSKLKGISFNEDLSISSISGISLIDDRRSRFQIFYPFEGQCWIDSPALSSSRHVGVRIR